MASAVHSGLLESRRTEVDPPASGRERGSEGLGVPDPAGQLDLDVEPPDDRVDQLAVRPAPEGGVQVDEVQPLGALLLPGEGRVQRVAELSAGAGHALDQLDRPAVGDVDGGEQLQPGPAHSDLTQFSRSWAPASPDFSGWNWVADSGPFSTAATKSAAVRRPRDDGGDHGERAHRVERPSLRGIRVHEVEPLVLDAGEQPRAGAGLHRRPAHVRDDPAGSRSTRPGHSPSPSSGGPETARWSRRRAPASRRTPRGPAARRRAARR